MRFLIFLAVLGLSTSAFAVDVYINGQKMGAVADVNLSGVDVRFDEKGNIHVSAPGYDVVAPGGGAAAAAAMPERTLKGTYCMAAETDAPGVVPYMFEVYLNGVKITDLSSNDTSTVMALTEFVKVGKNKIAVKALYQKGQRVAPAAKRKMFKVRAGKGVVQDGKCILDTSPVLYTRLARDNGDREDFFTFVAQ